MGPEPFAAPGRHDRQMTMSTLSGGYAAGHSPVPSATALATLPLPAVFAPLGEDTIGGIVPGAVKG